MRPSAQKVPVGSDGVSIPADLTAVPADKLRRMRANVVEAESGLSYLRRLAQGRLDIVAAEDERREAGDPPLEVAELIGRLPSILTGHASGPSRGRHPAIEAVDVDPLLLQRLERVVPGRQLASLGDVADARLTAIRVGLSDLEREVSARRRRLHPIIDRIEAEIGRRYRTGQLSPEDAALVSLSTNGLSADRGDLAAVGPAETVEPERGEPAETVGPAETGEPETG